MFTIDVDAQHIIRPNMVLCYTTSTIILNVFATGVSTTIFEFLFITYKLLLVPGFEFLFMTYKLLIVPGLKTIF